MMIKYALVALVDPTGIQALYHTNDVHGILIGNDGNFYRAKYSVESGPTAEGYSFSTTTDVWKEPEPFEIICGDFDFSDLTFMDGEDELTDLSSDEVKELFIRKYNNDDLEFTRSVLHALKS